MLIDKNARLRIVFLVKLFDLDIILSTCTYMQGIGPYYINKCPKLNDMLVYQDLEAIILTVYIGDWELVRIDVLNRKFSRPIIR